MANNTKTELNHWARGILIIGFFIASSLVLWAGIIWMLAAVVRPVL